MKRNRVPELNSRINDTLDALAPYYESKRSISKEQLIGTIEIFFVAALKEIKKDKYEILDPRFNRPIPIFTIIESAFSQGQFSVFIIDDEERMMTQRIQTETYFKTTKVKKTLKYRYKRLRTLDTDNFDDIPGTAVALYVRIPDLLSLYKEVLFASVKKANPSRKSEKQKKELIGEVKTAILQAGKLLVEQQISGELFHLGDFNSEQTQQRLFVSWIPERILKINSHHGTGKK